MPTKSFVYIGMFIGSIIGGYIPVLWGASLLSMSSVIFSAIGGILGIVLVFKFFK